MSYYFNFKRLFLYLKLLATQHFKSTSISFFVISIITYGSLWFISFNSDEPTNFFMLFFDTAFRGLNFVYLIMVAFISSKIFSNIHDPIKSMSEYALPISMEERFIGNFVFTYFSILFNILFIDIIILFISPGNFFNKYIEEISQQNIADSYFLKYSLIIIVFFTGSILFKKKPIVKTMVLLTFLGIISISLNQGGIEEANSNKTTIFIILILLTWAYSYLRLKTMQYK